MSVQPAEDFDTWYEASRPRVLATLILVSGDGHAAADATDEAFLRALARWPTVAAMRSPVGWTVRVGINVIRRRQRRHALEQRILRRERPPADVPAPAGEAWLAVRDLPRRQRETLVMRYVADMSELDISTSLGISRSAVSSALTDGRRALAEVFGEPNPEVDHVRHP
ncbi:MAG: sigma-70 family polymerase sigma factor [Ilumatobacteraceae bacterium]|nr:sigma-70 family polymerase sigma factor [Ilumatobacteraceae bacterium]